LFVLFLLVAIACRVDLVEYRFKRFYTFSNLLEDTVNLGYLINTDKMLALSIRLTVVCIVVDQVDVCVLLVHPYFSHPSPSLLSNPSSSPPTAYPS
jgi:hypothetical protein